MYSKCDSSYRLLFPGGEGVVHGAELGLVDRHLRREGCQGSASKISLVGLDVLLLVAQGK